MSKSRDDRFADIAELAEAVAVFAPASVAPSAQVARRIIGHRTLPAASAVVIPASAPRSRKRPIIGVVVVLAAIAAVTWIAFRGPKRQESRGAFPMPAAPASRVGPSDAGPVKSEVSLHRADASVPVAKDAATQSGDDSAAAGDRELSQDPATDTRERSRKSSRRPRSSQDADGDDVFGRRK
jgi:hypothetical protein